jgi:CDP-glucose 4,6-dehydratase
MEGRKRALESLVSDESRTFWQDKPVFVTGATGLLGSWLVKKLVERGASVVALVRDWTPESELFRHELLPKIKIVRGDIVDQAVMERALGEYEIETVFHLAAQTIVGIANRNPVSTFESNVRGTWTLLEAARRSPQIKQIVVASSDKAYGIHEKLPYTEDAPLRGTHPYDVSKSCADLIAQSYFTTFGLPVCVTRCGNLYGGGDLNWNRLIPGTIQFALRGKRPVIRSDGSFIRDYFYVEDGALAYIELAEAMAEKPEIAGESFNFSNELQITVLELTEKILQLMRREDLSPDVRDEVRHEIPHQWLSAAKAKRMLGWTPQFSIDEGLRRTIDWYTQFFERKGD